MRKLKPATLAIAIPIAVVGWALFRPELLFINNKVDEKLPISGQMAETIAKGTFTSFAHETKGTAEFVKTEGKTFLKLSDFTTSNGPDVHVYLVKGTDASDTGVNKNGFIDLGIIKGNIGNQFYELPSNARTDEYMGVAIWCKRFGVNFGGASLASSKPTKSVFRYAPPSKNSNWVNASFLEPIRVTGGKFSNGGTASLIEDSGKRWLEIKGLKLPTGRKIQVLLLKSESPKAADVERATKVDLGVAKSGVIRFNVDKSLDLWLYRSVSLWDVEANKSIGLAYLRSDQEKKSSPLA
jgi:hypothetical protein